MQHSSPDGRPQRTAASPPSSPRPACHRARSSSAGQPKMHRQRHHGHLPWPPPRPGRRPWPRPWPAAAPRTWPRSPRAAVPPTPAGSPAAPVAYVTRCGQMGGRRVRERERATNVPRWTSISIFDLAVSEGSTAATRAQGRFKVDAYSGNASTRRRLSHPLDVVANGVVSPAILVPAPYATSTTTTTTTTTATACAARRLGRPAEHRCRARGLDRLRHHVELDRGLGVRGGHGGHGRARGRAQGRARRCSRSVVGEAPLAHAALTQAPHVHLTAEHGRLGHGVGALPVASLLKTHATQRNTQSAPHATHKTGSDEKFR